MSQTTQQVAERWVKAFENGDMDGVGDCYHDDAVQEWPQSGERIVGKANMMAVNRNFPGMPSMSFRDVKHGGNIAVLEAELDYPDAGKYFGTSIIEIEDGLIVRQVDYFSEPFEAPEWRAQWVERM